MDLNNDGWKKSTHSGSDGGNCVEVNQSCPGIVAVRDSKDENGGALAFTSEVWNDFTTAIKEGLI